MKDLHEMEKKLLSNTNNKHIHNNIVLILKILVQSSLLYKQKQGNELNSVFPVVQPEIGLLSASSLVRKKNS